MLQASKTYKGRSPQGSWRSPLEGVAEALRGALLLREWPPVPFPPQDVCSLCVCVCVCVYGNTETSTADLRAKIRVSVA